ncbi:uncharacterized protein ColSpa_08686 [Colletotrichum spaethianum]|uniref:Azaphilone pigments biosynthesis cluster protein L N-terminal domain-containing protein n=1 Tax=Colletotrichum spaethianum TaxID=700344 RepID=A0AA37PAB0_9PEZI|nr:uncharacterized protein ColSpa_08686 [Colletotrichum spaethianum]GKT48505.1 hypothetical protein ColSpa_08686 [Colletotrichum spaethianum]
MAEAVGLASGVLTFASFAFKSSIALYTTVQGFRAHPKRVRDLLEELQALSEVLRLLTETINATPDVDFSALELPLRRCDDACKEFEQELLRCSSRSGGDRTSFRDWTKLQYMGDGVDDFTQLLAGYKSTINIALADAHLRQSATTAENLEKYRTMIITTTDDLEARLDSIDAKLAAVFERTVTEIDSDARELQRIRAERASTQKCLDICAQLADHINRIQQRPSQGPRTLSSVDAAAYPDRVTNDGLQACKERLAQTIANLEKHMQQLMDRLIEKSAAKMNSEHEVAQLATLREEWDTARQCLSICSSAENHVKENISIIDNYATGDDTVQFLVSTNGKTIHGKNRGYGSMMRQVGGHLSDASLQQMSRDISRISLQGTRKEGAPSQDGAFSTADDLVIQDVSNGDFKERYGRGLKLSETSDNGETHMTDVDGKLGNVGMHLKH